MNGPKLNRKISNVKEHREHVRRSIDEKVRDDACLTRNAGEFYGEQNLRLMYAYEYTKMWISNRTYDEMIDAAIHQGPLRKARETHNPFALGIQLLFDGEHFTRQKRSKYARALNYAYINDVPTIWLIGFIKLAGGPDLISKKLEEGDQVRRKEKKKKDEEK